MFSLFTKEKDPLNKENHRPVSLLSHMSKDFETLLYKQIVTFMNSKLPGSKNARKMEKHTRQR